MVINQRTIFFVYENASGEKTRRKVTVIDENDDYIRGIQLLDKGHRTFRKAQIIAYYDTENEFLHSEFPDPKPRANNDKTEIKPEICFTGFSAEPRKKLEQLAQENGLQVRTKVTTKLEYLCTGPNAGPKKMEEALSKGVVLMDETAFHWLIKTGEIPV